MQDNKKKIAYFLPILSGACWGSSGIFIRILANNNFDNMTMLFSRIFVGVIIYLILILLKDKSLLKINLKDLPIFISLAINGIIIMNLLYNLAMINLTLSLASVLLSTCPLFVAIIGFIFLKEKITLTKISLMLSTVVGCMLLSGIFEGKELTYSVAGILFGVGAAFFNAIYAFNAKQLTNRKYDTLTILFYIFLISSILVIWFCDFKTMGDFIYSKPMYGTGVILLQALGSCLLPNLLFNLAMAHLQSSTVSVISSGAEPVSAMVMGLVFFKEVPTIYGIIGMIIVVSSLTILTLKKEG